VSKHATGLTQLRDLPDEELRQALGRTRDELFRLQLGQYTNQVTSTAALTTKRRDVARILTILKGRQLGTETQAQKAASQATAKASTDGKAKRTAKTPKATKAKS
jgi:large subunit ribosomal protein L29